ncbi:MAG: glutamate synthase subunit beta [Desulfarculales bacterium]|jgi:glutamate synthase (NADPH/NADH) small chain|nr:glutamate synthase subunit beta [Desulfarculales bacterium]
MSRYRPVKERISDFAPVELRLPAEEMAEELTHCQDCGVPFCHGMGCPLQNIIPEINIAALAGHWPAALALLLSTNPFPELTARICPALCEGSCVQALNTKPVPFRLVEWEVIEQGFDLGLMTPNPPSPHLPLRRSGLKAAIIGSGPAGLAAAWALNQGGITVTVYEKDAQAGGFLRYGIPDFKLEKQVLDRRIRLLEAEGIKFEYNVQAGVDISARLLRQRYDILVLAAGARKKRDLTVSGRELAGIHFATDYLSAQNRLLAGELAGLPPEYNARNRRVVVIGGGDTGSDCVGTAWRQGARAVYQFEIMPQPPSNRSANNLWPEWPRILRTSSSHEEGGVRRWNIDTSEFLPAASDKTRLGALNCTEVEWHMENGRLSQPKAKKNSKFIQEADMALLALGFSGVEENPLLTALGIPIEPTGRIPRDQRGRVSDKIYACGDAAMGASLAVRAIADGLAVAGTVLSDCREQTDPASLLHLPEICASGAAEQ